MPNVKLFFNHKLTGADLRRKKAWFEVVGGKEKTLESRDKEIEIAFDFIIGADGAHSATRYHMMKYTRMNYKQEYIDTLWCEFTILARERNKDNPESRFAISPHHLHIWPGHEFMFIAIPNYVSSTYSSLLSPLLTQPLGRFIHMHPLPPFLPLLHP
jgi:kynurenine 3-monooxygenase